jgi:hypothetical protein
MEPWLIAVVVVVAGLAVGARRAAVANRRRAAALAQLAALQGWARRDRDDALPERFTGVPFGRGIDRRAEDILEGAVQGRPFVSFDYVYDLVHGEDRTQNTHAVCAVTLPSPVPRLEIFPPIPLPLLGHRSDLPVVPTGHAELDRRYRVRTRHPEFARRVLSPAAVELLLAPDFLSACYWLDGDHAVCWDYEGRDADRLLHELATLAALVAGCDGGGWP